MCSIIVFGIWHLQVLDEVFKGAHVEHQPKVSPSAATPTEVVDILWL
jgi:hypothetical protein